MTAVEAAALAGMRRALDDVGVYSAGILGRPLRRYQLEIARAVLASVVDQAGLTFTVLMPRQAGKNELSAQVEAFLLARHQRTGGQLVKAAPTFKPQVQNSIRRLKTMLDQSPLTKGRYRSSGGYILELGRASILFFSGEPHAQVVGGTANLLLEGDEAQDLDGAKWDKDFRPMGATANVTTVLYGTPWVEDDLLATSIETARALERRDGRRRHFAVPREAVAAENPLYGRYVAGEIARLGAEHPIIQTQYLLKMLPRAGGFLSNAQLALLQGVHQPQALPGPLPGVAPGSYVAAIDVAGADEADPDGLLTRVNRSRDSTVVMVAHAEPARVDEAVLEPRLRVVAIYAWRGTPHRELYPQVLGLVRELWGCASVVVDATGVGSGLAAFLGAALGPRIVSPYVYTAATKSTLAYAFLTLVNNRRLTLPAPAIAGHDDTEQLRREFFAQAAAAERELRAHQQMTFFVPERRGHDDLLNAAALLSQASPLGRHRTAVGRRQAAESGQDAFPAHQRQGGAHSER